MLELLVGPIASGKSTYSNKAAKEGAIIVNDDAIVTALHGGDHTLYDKALKPRFNWFFIRFEKSDVSADFEG